MDESGVHARIYAVSSNVDVERPDRIEIFQQDPSGPQSRRGAPEIVLTPTERAALLATPAETWDAIAAALDSRLQEIALPQDEPVA